MTAAAPTRRTVIRLAVPCADATFRALGTDVRLRASGPGAHAAVRRARSAIVDYHARLSRFLDASELSALNRDPRAVVPASDLLRSAVRAALWAAHRSGGLVDPCLLDRLEAAGYRRSLEPGGPPQPPAGPRSVAAPDPASAWPGIRVDDAAGTIARPAGLRLDLGGTGKGHAADLVARELEALPRWVVDCGGDVRLGGTHDVEVAHPLGGAAVARVRVAGGAIATSSVMARAWTAADGRPAHHLLDPHSGEPVRTGLLSATALAPTVLEAETLAKVALLTGPAGARRVLAPRGGLVVHEDGTAEALGPLPEVAR